MNYFSILQYVIGRDVDQAMTEKIRRYTETTFAASETTEVFASMQDVNGFKFLTITLAGPASVRTFKGCKVLFSGPAKQKELESDTVEIETDYSKKLSMGLTSFDIDLDGDLEQEIRNRAFEKLEVHIEKQVFSFTITDPARFIEILDRPSGGDEDGIDTGENIASPIGPMY